MNEEMFTDNQARFPVMIAHFLGNKILLSIRTKYELERIGKILTDKNDFIFVCFI